MGNAIDEFKIKTRNEQKNCRSTQKSLLCARIIAEKYMTNDDSSPELTDYKFFCYDGYADCVMVCLEGLKNEFDKLFQKNIHK